MKGAINIVSKHCGGPTRDCELVSLSPRAERGPDTDIPRGSGCGIVRVARRLHRTMTLTSRWKPREYGNTGSLSLSPPTNHSFPERVDATAEGNKIRSRSFLRVLFFVPEMRILAAIFSNVIKISCFLSSFSYSPKFVIYSNRGNRYIARDIFRV